VEERGGIARELAGGETLGAEHAGGAAGEALPDVEKGGAAVVRLG